MDFVLEFTLLKRNDWLNLELQIRVRLLLKVVVTIRQTWCIYGVSKMVHLKGKYQANLISFQNPKMFVCQKQSKLSSFVINYHQVQ